MWLVFLNPRMIVIHSSTNSLDTGYTAKTSAAMNLYQIGCLIRPLLFQNQGEYLIVNDLVMKCLRIT